MGKVPARYELAQAAAQQMPRQWVLDTVDATLLPPPGTDAGALLQRLTTCVEGVRQRMGLPAKPPAPGSAQEADGLAVWLRSYGIAEGKQTKVTRV